LTGDLINFNLFPGIPASPCFWVVQYDNIG